MIASFSLEIGLPVSNSINWAIQVNISNLDITLKSKLNESF